MIVLYASLTASSLALLLAGTVLDRDGLLIAALSTASVTAGLLIGEAL